MNKPDLAKLVQANPLMAEAIVTYSYYQEYGSDGCWGQYEQSTSTLSEWLAGLPGRHSGNRSYNFGFVSLEEVTNEVLTERRDAKVKLHKELLQQEREKAQMAREKALKFQSRINSWVGQPVTVKGKSGKVERAMSSQFKEDTVAVLVAFADGTKKWHSEGAVKQVMSVS